MDEKIVKDSQGLVKDLVNDCISRKAAIDAIDSVLVEEESCKVWFKLAVKNLPSAQPEPLKIHLTDDKYEKLKKVMREQPLMLLQKDDAQPGWIPCSERLPEKPYGCLVTVWDTNPITMDEFENILPYFVGWDGEQWNDADGEQCPFEVIAWMPLPEPYEKDGDKK